jgi:hypothetical protein
MKHTIIIESDDKNSIVYIRDASTVMGPYGETGVVVVGKCLWADLDMDRLAKRLVSMLESNKPTLPIASIDIPVTTGEDNA